MRPLDRYIKDQLDTHIASIGKQLGGADTMSIVGSIVPARPIVPGGLIVPGIDTSIRTAIEMKKERAPVIAVILETRGGVVEVVEQIVEMIRHFYQEVVVIVPGQAMSAGTVFALSADRIMMDYFSRLGPIDPQVMKDGKLVPALSYLIQYERLNKKSEQKKLTTAEYGILSQLNVGELYKFEQARELSVELLRQWLSQYKFKNWAETETRKMEVTDKMKKDRAEEIAMKLNDPGRWHSHGRGIDINTLRSELNLKIEDYSENEQLSASTKSYLNLLIDYIRRQREELIYFIHSEEYF